jgi:hypothetical protein
MRVKTSSDESACIAMFELTAISMHLSNGVAFNAVSA